MVYGSVQGPPCPTMCIHGKHKTEKAAAKTPRNRTEQASMTGMTLIKSDTLWKERAELKKKLEEEAAEIVQLRAAEKAHLVSNIPVECIK